MIYWFCKFFTDPAAHKKAFWEVLTVIAFTFALYLGSFLRNNAHSPISLEGNLLERGEIFLLIYALFGTLFYLAFIHIDKPSNGVKKIFGLIITVSTIPIVVMSGFDPTFKSIVNEQVNVLGYCVYGLFVFSYYVLLFYQELSPPDPQQVLGDGAKNMASEARELNK